MLRQILVLHVGRGRPQMAQVPVQHLTPRRLVHELLQGMHARQPLGHRQGPGTVSRRSGDVDAA
ncbi:hypothetical protein ACF08M_37535 [Streptomyces sp. NPDC015032]|uniref:hypothetical protein n=1 Tax=Streptomyces sp. NPDC015032 TaxID=3364937 RepID=UPI0036FEA5C8